VPVFVGHSEAINIEFEEEISAKQAQDILREAPGVMLIDKREDAGYVTPIECVGDFATFISRVREDPTVDSGLSLWCVSDNLRKGAALNAVQIAELLGRRHLKKQGEGFPARKGFPTAPIDILALPPPRCGPKPRSHERDPTTGPAGGLPCWPISICCMASPACSWAFWSD